MMVHIKRHETFVCIVYHLIVFFRHKVSHVQHTQTLTLTEKYSFIILKQNNLLLFRQFGPRNEYN